MLHFAGRGSDMSFTSSSLNVIPYSVFPFCCFDPSVKISIFSWSYFIVNSVLFSMLILYFLFSNEVGSILSVGLSYLIFIHVSSIQSILSSVVWYFSVLLLCLFQCHSVLRAMALLSANDSSLFSRASWI